MDVSTPVIPPEYDSFRHDLRAFVAERGPKLRSKPRAGVRIPEEPEDIAALRRWVGELHDAGFQRVPWAAAGSVDPFELRIIDEELKLAGLPMLIGNPLVGHALETFGTAEQKERFMPRMARADDIWCQLFSEPDAGSDLASMTTFAQKDGDDYIVNGQKVWTTWGSASDYGFLLARTDRSVPKHAGITAFAIEMSQPGVRVHPLREITGTSDFSEVFFTDARVRAADCIGEENQGWSVATSALVAERFTAGELGETLLDDVLDVVALARDARLCGNAALSESWARQNLAKLYERALILRLLRMKAATHEGRGDIRPTDAPVQKLYFSELFLDVATEAVRLLGPAAVLGEEAPGVREGGRWQDMFLYGRAFTIAGGSSEIMRTFVAERGLGMPKEVRRGTTVAPAPSRDPAMGEVGETAGSGARA